MDCQREKSASIRAARRTCKPAGTGTREPWNLFFEPQSENDPSEFSISDTEEILFALAVAVEQRDHQTAGHCERLAWTSVALGVALGLARTCLVTLYRAGFLHDVGKVGIPDAILFKPGKLTAEEWVTMRSHTTRGEEICRPMASLSPVLPVIRHHHERWDGSGYPDGLRGEQIPQLARVLQIADIYDALVSPRPYKPPYTPNEALEIIQQETDRGWRDPELVKTFLVFHQDFISKNNPHLNGEQAIGSMRNSLLKLEQSLTAGSGSTSTFELPSHS